MLIGSVTPDKAEWARTSTSQIVQVVSMLDVPIIFGSASFQSNEVRGAQYSLFVFCVAATAAVLRLGLRPGNTWPARPPARPVSLHC